MKRAEEENAVGNQTSARILQKKKKKKIVATILQCLYKDVNSEYTVELFLVILLYIALKINKFQKLTEN